MDCMQLNHACAENDERLSLFYVPAQSTSVDPGTEETMAFVINKVHLLRHLSFFITEF